MAELQEAEIRARIKSARKEAGLSQTKMAELLGVIPRTVQNYENDHVPWQRIRDIAEITGRSTRWLLHGEEQQEDDDRVADGLERLETAVSRLGERLEALLESRGIEQDEAAVQAAERARQQADGRRRAAGQRAGA